LHLLLHYLVKHWCQQNKPLSCGATNRIHNRLAATSVHGSSPMIHIRSRTAISEPQAVRVHNVCSYMYRHFPLDVPPGMPPWGLACCWRNRTSSLLQCAKFGPDRSLVHEPPPKKKLKASLQYFAFHLRQHAFQIWPGSVMGARLQEPPRSRNYHLLFSWSTLPLTVQQAVFLFSVPGVAASITQSIMSHKTPFSTFHLIIFSL